MAKQTSMVAMAHGPPCNGALSSKTAAQSSSITSLRGTRGAAVAVAELDDESGVLTFGGVGNISGRLLSGLQDRSLLSQHGTVGAQIRRPQDVTYPWPDHAMLVLHSDGIATRWNLSETPGLLLCEPAVLAGWLLREYSRGRDDATVVVVRRSR